MKKTIATTCIVVFLSLFAFQVSAYAKSEREGRRIDYLMPEYGNLAHVRYTYSFPAGFNTAPNQKVAYHAFNIGGLVPIAIKDNFLFGIGSDFYLHNFRIDEVRNYYNKPGITVYNIALSLHGILFFGNDWFLDINFVPTISSDLKEWSGHDFQMNGNAVAGWAFNDWASLLFGVAVGKEFWTYMPFPVLGMVVRPEGSIFECEIVLPSYARFNFKVASFLKLFAMGKYEGFVWDMKGDGMVPNHFMKMVDTHAGAGAEFKIIKGLLFEIWGGVNPYRKYDYRDRTGNAYKDRQKTGYFIESSFSVTPEILGL